MKVYVVFSIPDSIGIDIEFIYSSEADAIDCVKIHNEVSPSYDQWGYDVYELL